MHVSFLFEIDPWQALSILAFVLSWESSSDESPTALLAFCRLLRLRLGFFCDEVEAVSRSRVDDADSADSGSRSFQHFEIFVLVNKLSSAGSSDSENLEAFGRSISLPPDEERLRPRCLGGELVEGTCLFEGSRLFLFLPPLVPDFGICSSKSVLLLFLLDSSEALVLQFPSVR